MVFKKIFLPLFLILLPTFIETSVVTLLDMNNHQAPELTSNVQVQPEVKPLSREPGEESHNDNTDQSFTLSNLSANVGGTASSDATAENSRFMPLKYTPAPGDINTRPGSVNFLFDFYNKVVGPGRLDANSKAEIDKTLQELNQLRNPTNAINIVMLSSKIKELERLLKQAAHQLSNSSNNPPAGGGASAATEPDETKRIEIARLPASKKSAPVNPVISENDRTAGNGAASEPENFLNDNLPAIVTGVVLVTGLLAYVFLRK